MDLFSNTHQTDKADIPLALRMRPCGFEDFVGQEHIIGPGKLLTRAIAADRLSSVIFYGPSGSGKNCLAHIISTLTKSHFHTINAVASNSAQLRKVLESGKHRRRMSGEKTILFIDEIHRFNKAQQDILMPYMEASDIILIGATTHNPFFYIIPALISRSLVFQLEPLSPRHIVTILKKAVQDKKKGLGSQQIRMDDEALDFLAMIADGDARRALNALEIGVNSTPQDRDGYIPYSKAVAEESIQKKAVNYDKAENNHFDSVSAFIKSMRGSDPDAALYWLAKMLYAGEDPRFIARRIVICAAEDIGNADPQALILANAAFQAVEFLGMPEARIPLAQAVVYISTAPKSNASYMGIEKALEDVKNKRTLEVPAHLKNIHDKSIGLPKHGKTYKYAHDYEGHYVDQDYLPDKRQYYKPADSGYEKHIKAYLDKLKPGARNNKANSDKTNY
jgi:putative ATPase